MTKIQITRLQTEPSGGLDFK